MPVIDHNHSIHRPTAGIIAALAFAAVMIATPPAWAQATAAASLEIWESLKPDVFGDRVVHTGTGVIHVVAPKRAQEAGLVPVEIEIDPAMAHAAIVSITLIIDVNPSPVAAKFTIGENSGLRKLSTRVRVNDYSYVRAIAETASGELHMAETFVKASGGCSAPAAKNPDEAKASMGAMKLRQFPPQEVTELGVRRELQLMIRHPNHSGFQMDQVTRYFIPAHFVRDVKVSRDGVMLLRMEGGISISEDPNFRFDYAAKAGGEIEVEAIDTEDKVFRDKWPVEAAGL